MKKFSCISIVLVMSIFFVACGAKTPSNTNTSSNTNNTSKSDTTNNTSDLPKEFSYLPSYGADMKLENFTPPSQGKQGYGTAKYTIKNTNNNDALKHYEDILKKDGWTIYEDKKPVSIAAKKDDHQVAILPAASGSDVLLTIISK
ncbi:hypothetical protein [Clostridium sp. OS1-26]|uniref:hypothetical protein n=1 Tax=Clostridium sp. OS1-26 TaxID=3070681 RepID=UPI0027DF0449|nr:hypothetical protein [Clostridium sp. OS1-26]WML35934.1 hypothetical protein RCG18_04085 [Clostridium sp. OS1-26]